MLGGVLTLSNGTLSLGQQLKGAVEDCWWNESISVPSVPLYGSGTDLSSLSKVIQGPVYWCAPSPVSALSAPSQDQRHAAELACFRAPMPPSPAETPTLEIFKAARTRSGPAWPSVGVSHHRRPPRVLPKINSSRVPNKLRYTHKEDLLDVFLVQLLCLFYTFLEWLFDRLKTFLNTFLQINDLLLN